jgi:hypothetical protein
MGRLSAATFMRHLTAGHGEAHHTPEDLRCKILAKKILELARSLIGRVFRALHD